MTIAHVIWKGCGMLFILTCDNKHTGVENMGVLIKTLLVKPL